MPATPEDLLAEYDRLAQRMREIQQEIVRSQLPEAIAPPDRFRRHLGLIEGGKTAAMAVAGAVLGSVAFLRHHLAGAAVLAVTAGVLMWSPATPPAEPPDPIALPPSPSIGPSPLEPRPRPPTEDTGEDDRGDAAPDSSAPETESSEVIEAEPVDIQSDGEPVTPDAPDDERREPPRREPEPGSPPGAPGEPRRQCLVLDVPPEADLPACLAEVERMVDELPL